MPSQVFKNFLVFLLLAVSAASCSKDPTTPSGGSDGGGEKPPISDPMALQLVLPNEEGILPVGSVPFVWSRPQDWKDSLQFQVSSDSGFDSLITAQIIADLDTTVQLQTTDYYYLRYKRVAESTPEGYVWTDTVRFGVREKDPANLPTDPHPDLFKPLPDTVRIGEQIVLEWDSTSQSTHKFFYQISLQQDFSNLILDDSTDSYRAISSLVLPDIYYFRYRRDVGPLEGYTWVDETAFTAIPGDPDSLVLISPMDSSQVNGDPAVFIWQDPPGEYETIQIEIATDRDFQTVVYTDSTTGQSLEVQLPSFKAYYLRYRSSIVGLPAYAWQDTLYFITMRSFGGGGDEEVVDMLRRPNGNLLVFGHSTSYGGGDEDLFLMELDSDFNVVWEQSYGGANNETALTIRTVSDGGYVLTGRVENDTNDNVIYRVDAQGSEQWGRELITPNSNQFSGVTIERLGGGYLFAGNGTRSAYVQWLDTSGDSLSEAYYNSPSGFGIGIRDVIQTDNGNFFATGSIIAPGGNGYSVYALRIAADGTEFLNTIIYGGGAWPSGWRVWETSLEKLVIFSRISAEGLSSGLGMHHIEDNVNTFNKAFRYEEDYNLGIYMTGVNRLAENRFLYLAVDYRRDSDDYWFVLESDADGNEVYSRNVALFGGFDIGFFPRAAVLAPDNSGYYVCGDYLSGENRQIALVFVER
ncbi:MAG: hypothetical protein ACRBF0_13100 [Calditrichia bacterium]